MTYHTTQLSSPKTARWDQHCRLVIQFPISLRSQVRLSARFDGFKLELRPKPERGAPFRARDFFLHPTMLPFAFGFGRPGSEVKRQISGSASNTVQPA